MKKLTVFLLAILLLVLPLAGCGTNGDSETSDPTVTTTEPIDPTEGIAPENIYYVGPDREHKSMTQLFLDLKDDTQEKVIFLDEGTYDIFQEYKDANIPSPPDTVESPDYFTYNAFLPANTKLIGIGQVKLDFSPEADEITYGESRTWAPLNIINACHIENIEIYCKNGRYCIHDDSHNKDKDTTHYYKNVRCVFESGDTNADGKRLGFSSATGNGMAQGTTFLFEDCTFEYKGNLQGAAFYTHESGERDPLHVPTLTFRNCTFIGGAGNPNVVRLQNLAKAYMQIPTRFENCTIDGGIFLEIYNEESHQHYDVTLVNSGNPTVKIDKESENRFRVKIEE